MDQIKTYIEQARQHGQSDIVTKEALLSAGWDPGMVEQAFGGSAQGEPYPTQSGLGASVRGGNKAGDIPGLNQMDVPKKWSQFQQIKAMIWGIIAIFLSPVLGMIIYSKDNHQAGVLVGAVGSLFGLLLAVSSFISYRQLRHAEKNPSPHNQFQTSTATEYAIPKQALQNISSDESIINWIGPVIRADKGAVGYSVLSKEVLKQAENTLLFTQSQIVPIMLTPEDTHNIQQGTLGNAASAFINYSSEEASEKNQQFRILHARKWDQLVANVQNQPLQSIMQTHLCYSIPYASIKSFKIKNSLVNPGFVFELTDGSKLRFGVYRKDKIKEITALLQQHIKMQK